MGPLDLLTAPLRSLLGATEDMERDAEYLLAESGKLEHQLDQAVASIHRAAESMEHHVEVVETLATSVPALTESVNALVKELNGLLAVLAPVAAAEHEVSRLGHLFGRRHAQAPAATPTSAPSAPLMGAPPPSEPLKGALPSSEPEA
jgi:ABC-type transporter Mla subunit MlaD